MNAASYIILSAVVALWAGVLARTIHKSRKARLSQGRCDSRCQGCALARNCAAKKHRR